MFFADSPRAGFRRQVLRAQTDKVSGREAETRGEFCRDLEYPAVAVSPVPQYRDFVKWRLVSVFREHGHIVPRIFGDIYTGIPALTKFRESEFR